MIVSAVLRLLGALLTLIVSPLPTTELDLSASAPSWVTDGSGQIGFLDNYLPISEMVGALGLVVLTYLPAVIAYQTVNWLYRHIPVLGGGG